MARLARPQKTQEPKKSLLERFDGFIGTRIAPLVSAIKKGDIKQLASELKTNVQLQNKRLKEQGTKGVVDLALNFSPAGISKIGKPVKKGIVETVKNFVRPAENVIARQGEAGKVLKKTLTTAIDKGEVEAGKRVAQITQARLNKLTKIEKQNLFDALEGRAQPISPKVEEAFRITRTQTDELAQYAKQVGVLQKRKVTLKPDAEIPKGVTSLQRQRLLEGNEVKATIRVPFEPRANFFPHTQISIDNLKGAVRTDIAENIVRLGVKKDLAEATKFIDDYKAFIDNGGKQESLINYMVETGQSASAAEALSNLQRYRNKTIKRSGSLEFSRDIDLPFYDPDPSRVIPKFVAEEAARIEQIRAFKQDQQVINKLILEIRNSGGDSETVRTIVDRSLGMLNDAKTPAAKVSRMLRMVQGFKLGLAAIPNSTQGTLNSLLKADLRAVAAGVAGLLTKRGRLFALQSGATLESTLQETARESGALSKFLKATGFTATERANRTLAANAGKSYGTRLFKKLLNNPKNKTARRLLEEFGIDPEQALKNGKLTEDDILMFAKKFTDITQFRSRPQDLPMFASSPAGKVFFQFKTFIYGQTRLLYRETVGELKNKNFGRATRNLFILGTVFPLTGEVVADIRALITGRKREEKGLARYLDNIAQVGSMGILMDTLRAGKYRKGTEFIAGPSVSDAGELINVAGGTNKGKNFSKFLLKKIPIVGSRISNEVFPSESAKAKRPTGTRRKLR